MKVLLVLLDGMRPDSITNVPEAQAMIARGSSAMDAQTVFPSVTLPCHMSLFHSVDPDRHGITTNIYTPQVRPIDGLVKVLKNAGKKCAFFRNWEQLRDLSRPGYLAFDLFINGKAESWEHSTELLADAAISYISQYSPDFTFFYTGLPDETGHAKGWMGPEYLDAVDQSWKAVQRIVDTLDDDYVVFVTTDHGGHGRGHGTTMLEDMTIPVIITGGPFSAGNVLDNVSIKDIAPTIAALLGAQAAPEWEGKVLF